jgi:hypothetical protein
LWLAASIVVVTLSMGNRAHAATPSLVVRYDKAVRTEPFTGRVTLFFSEPIAESDRERPLPNPRLGPNWFRPAPFLSVDVRDWSPEDDFVIDPAAESTLWFPAGFDVSTLPGRAVQAVARFNPWEREVGTGPGNGMSEPVLIRSGETVVSLPITSLVPRPEFDDTDWSRELIHRSELLSTFHGREVVLKACVTLPASYLIEPERRYPVLYIIPGFGGTHTFGRRDQPLVEKNPGGVEFLRVTLDPSCPYGHHVFANSATNGPWGDALVSELIPAIEAAYRTDARPAARFLTGHSSGGWSSLWLQVRYPDAFNGTWSTAPDPVDFHDFQQINLYEEANVWRDAAGERRPIARRGDTPVLWFQDFDRMETVLGPGGQLLSFDAVFGPRGAEGRPLLAWDRQTGAVQREVVEHWKQFDIVQILKSEWSTLGPKLAGKLHVFMGDRDTFYLEGATKRLKAALEELGSDAVVEIVPGKDHGSLLTPELGTRIRSEMAGRYQTVVGK